MRTKEQITKVLVDRIVEKMVSDTKWTDLVSVLTNATVAERQGLVNLIINRSDGGRQAGIQLQKAVFINARERAHAQVESMLSDDGLTLEELDALL